MTKPDAAVPTTVWDNLQEACWDLPAHPQAVGKARELAREVLRVWSLPGLVEEVTVIVSELVTNAIVHGSPPITFALHRRGPLVRGEVTDHGAGRPAPVSAGTDQAHGRGLAIVSAYCARWGVEPAPGGKTVWFICAAAREHPR